MNSFFSDPVAKRDIEHLYHQKLTELSIACEFVKLETSYGETNVIITGSENKPPLVLLHGSNGCAPVAIEALMGLLNDFRIYAFDVVGQPNLSAEIRPNMKDDSYGKWMNELLTRLDIKDAVLVGISFGGFISWKTLVFDEKRIAKAFLIVPAGIVNGNPLQAIRKVFLPMKLYKWRKQEKYVRRFLGELFTADDPFALAFLSKLFLHYEMDFSPIPVIKKEEAGKIKTPTYIVGAENDLLFPGQKMMRRAKGIFPALQDVLMLENSRHVPDNKGNDLIVEWIKKKV